MKSFQSITILFFFFLPNTVKALVPLQQSKKDNKSIRYSSIAQLSVEEIVCLNSMEVSQKIKRNLSWKEKIVFRVTKRKLNKAIEAGKSRERLNEIKIEGVTKKELWAFLLGFFLPILGIILAYLFIERSAVIYSWIGLLSLVLVAFVVALVYLIVLIALLIWFLLSL